MKTTCPLPLLPPPPRWFLIFHLACLLSVANASFKTVETSSALSAIASASAGDVLTLQSSVVPYAVSSTSGVVSVANGMTIRCSDIGPSSSSAAVLATKCTFDGGGSAGAKVGIFALLSTTTSKVTIEGLILKNGEQAAERGENTDSFRSFLPPPPARARAFLSLSLFFLH